MKKSKFFSLFDITPRISYFLNTNFFCVKNTQNLFDWLIQLLMFIYLLLLLIFCFVLGVKLFEYYLKRHYENIKTGKIVPGSNKSPHFSKIFFFFFLSKELHLSHFFIINYFTQIYHILNTFINKQKINGFLHIFYLQMLC